MTWERRRYRGNKAWVEVDDSGALVLDERGLAQLRYKPDDERTYTVRPEEVHSLEDEAPPPGDEGITVFTDGASSGNPGPAGLGVVLLWKGRRREIREFLGTATNNEAELRAVLVALQAIRRPELPVEIRTDSEYVIGVLAGGHKVKANVDLVADIHAAMKRFANLSFSKVPAHAGVEGNERADALAREAIRTRPG